MASWLDTERAREHRRETFYAGESAGQPCKRGQSAARTGCIPKQKGAGAGMGRGAAGGAAPKPGKDAAPTFASSGETVPAPASERAGGGRPTGDGRHVLQASKQRAKSLPGMTEHRSNTAASIRELRAKGGIKRNADQTAMAAMKVRNSGERSDRADALRNVRAGGANRDLTSDAQRRLARDVQKGVASGGAGLDPRAQAAPTGIKGWAPSRAETAHLDAQREAAGFGKNHPNTKAIAHIPEHTRARADAIALHHGPDSPQFAKAVAHLAPADQKAMRAYVTMEKPESRKPAGQRALDAANKYRPGLMGSRIAKRRKRGYSRQDWIALEVEIERRREAR